jgi:hypothetical protein
MAYLHVDLGPVALFVPAAVEISVREIDPHRLERFQLLQPAIGLAGVQEEEAVPNRGVPQGLQHELALHISAHADAAVRHAIIDVIELSTQGLEHRSIGQQIQKTTVRVPAKIRR